VRRGANLQIAYYDQQREQLDPERTVFDTIADGSELITVNGQPEHVYGYLHDFLFPKERANSRVKSLSGGERNRLLLARLFTRPANILVLDEPTNDLDIETLELLEARLIEFPGTLLLVSHDRTFIDNVVTSTLVFEGEGRVLEYVGGYDDWLRQRTTAAPSTPVARRQPATRRASAPSGRPTYREQQELKQLPDHIERLEAEQRQLSGTINDPGFYKEPGQTIKAALERLGRLEQEILDAYARWAELDGKSR